MADRVIEVEATPAKPKSKTCKILAAVQKEGGKKGQDVCGMNEMGGGNEFFVIRVDEPAGDLSKTMMVMDYMNKPVDPSSEERRGGAGDVGKCIFSHGENSLSIVAMVPENLTDKVSASNWVQTIANKVGAKVVGGWSKTQACAVLYTDKENEIFPIKKIEDAVPAGYQYLVDLGVVKDDGDDDDDDYVPAEDDDDGEW